MHPHLQGAAQGVCHAGHPAGRLHDGAGAGPLALLPLCTCQVSAALCSALRCVVLLSVLRLPSPRPAHLFRPVAAPCQQAICRPCAGHQTTSAGRPPLLSCRVSSLTRQWTYAELVRSQFGRAGALLLQLSIVVNNGGTMVVYLIILGGCSRGWCTKGWGRPALRAAREQGHQGGFASSFWVGDPGAVNNCLV